MTRKTYMGYEWDDGNKEALKSTQPRDFTKDEIESMPACDCDSDSSDRFDFEEKLMDCWNVVNDLTTVMDSSENLTKEELLDVIRGVTTLSNLKFQKMMNLYDTLVSTGQYR